MASNPARVAPRVGWAAAIALAVVAAVSPVMAASGAGAGTTRRPAQTGETSQGWALTPAGNQTNVGAGPQAVAVSPNGAMVVVANAGYVEHSLMVVDPATGAITQTIAAKGGKSKHNAWQYSAGHAHGFYVGLTFSPDGRTLYASDSPRGAILKFAVDGTSLVADGVIGLGQKKDGGPWPAGIAVTPDGGRVLAAGNLDDSLIVADPSTRKVVGTVAVGHLPYGVALDAKGTTAFVSNWGDDTVAVVDIAKLKVVDTVRVGLHPNAIVANPNGDEIYVANADADTVSVLSTSTHQVLRWIDLHPYVGAPIGASPVALAVSPDGSTLYVANAGDNDIAVVALGPPGSSGGDTVLGLIPTGWWPSGVAVDATGSSLFVPNMFGHGVDPATKRRNHGNWKPSGGIKPNYAYWIASMRGTLSTIPVPDTQQLAEYTAQVAQNDRFGGGPKHWPGHVIPSVPGAPSPITHVIYVMKENRTYDQLLGDLGRGDGDPSLAIFGQKVTPNTHALAKQFVTLDDFSSDGDVSVDGWSWSNGAFANDYLERNWPLDYGRYGRPEDFGGFGNNETAGQPGTQPGRSYLWDLLGAAGISYENFGFFMDNPPDPVSSMPGLLGHTDMNYPGWDLQVPDQSRIAEWLHVFHGYEKRGDMPTMQFVYLPSDHTWATTPGARRPTAYVADNDYALGRLVDAVSHSAFWASTAIFVVEDDTQDGPDHVSGHRMPALVVSPYTQTGAVDSTAYSTASALRTMELILGVGAMTQFDWAATPMTAAFTDTPNLAPFDALPPEVSLWAKNKGGDPMSQWSAAADFSHPDLMNPQMENEAIWESVFGAGSTMPRPPDYGDGTSSRYLTNTGFGSRRAVSHSAFPILFDPDGW